VLLTVALLVSTGASTIEPATTAARSGQLDASGTGSSDTLVAAERRWRIAGEIAAAQAMPASRAPAPLAMVEPMSDEPGNLRLGHSTVTLGNPYRIEPVPTTVVEIQPIVKPWTGRFNLFRESAFVTQKTFRWCVAASVQMMVNLVRNHTDRTMATQARMIAYAQHWDNGPYGEDGGTDVTGWTTALRHFGAGNYRAVGATTAAKALRLAATAMRQTGRPAGILVMEGRHAWVLHGFESRTDPRSNAWARITAVRVSGPLYPLQQKSGYDPRPNTRLSVAKLERYFQPSSVGSLAGKYVVVIPTH
jgi:hypothetical protein